MTDLWQDARVTLRRWARAPGFTAAAVLTLGLGIGATSAIFSVVHAVLVRPVPYVDPERLVLVSGAHRREGGWERWPVSYPDWADFRTGAGTLIDLAAVSDQPASFNLSGDGEPERVSGEMVSAGTFRLLGVEARLGRVFSPEEDRPGASRRVALLGHDLWRRRFGGDPGVVGRSLQLNGEGFTVVGVMPPGFHGLTDRAQVWLPVSLADQVLSPGRTQERFVRWLAVVGRLADGATAAQAQKDLDTVAFHLERRFPLTNEGYGVRVTPLMEAWFGALRPALLTLFGGAGCVLFIACVNVANLLLAQAVRRGRELAVRSALGAGRGRLAGQLLTESVLLALAGCATGLLLARWSTGWLVAASAASLRSFVRIDLSPAVVGFTMLLAVLCGLGVGVAPAWTTSRRDAGTLKAGGRSSTPARRRFQDALVVAEVALALVLAIGAGLTAQSFRQLRRTDLGFRPEGLLTLRVDLKGKGYVAGDQSRLARQLLERVGALPGVQAMALSGPVLPTDDWYAMDFAFEGRPADERPILPYQAVTPGYFETLGIPRLAGRGFTFADSDTSPEVIIVSRTLAGRIWPGQDPIGRRMKVPGPPGANNPWLTVVGVVGDVAHQGLDPKLRRPGPDVYLPLLQMPQEEPVLGFLIRPAGVPAASLAAPVREAVRSVVPDLPVYDVATMEERLARQAGGDRFLTALMGLFALLALGLAAIGIYGVVSCGVVQRRREIGLRMALGARRSDVLRLVVGQTLTLAAGGVLLGALAALSLRRVLASRLHGVAPTDAPTFVLATAVLFAVALLASFLPARAAARIEPRTTLDDADSL